MAASFCKHSRPLLTLFSKPSIWKKEALLFSQYAPKYQPPLTTKEEIEQALKEKHEDEIKALYVKAPPNNYTSSVFYDPDVRKFTNYVMRKGKKETARELVEEAFLTIKHIQLRKYNEEKDPEVKSQILIRPLDVFHAAVKNVTPIMNVKKIKKSGTWYQVPCGVKEHLAKFLGMRWLIEAGKDKGKKVSFGKQLGLELLAASNYEGKAVNRKLELHKLCEANKGYASYKWT